MISYLYYNSKTPMSELGHAMFADSREAIRKFGNTLYTVDSNDLIDI